MNREKQISQPMNRKHSMDTINTACTPTLIQLVKGQQWRDVMERCQTAPAAEYLEQDPDSFRRTALHLACSNKKTPSNVIVSLLSHCHSRRAMTVEDTYNRYLPLHCALRYRASIATISVLLQHSSRSVLSAKDRQGWTSAHLACQFAKDVSIIELLLKNAPYLCRSSDRFGTTLLDLVVRRKDDVSSVIQQLLREYPECMTRSLPSSSISTSNHHNKNANWSPLHVAIWYGAPYATIQALVEAHPKSLIQTTTSGQTPLALYWNSAQPITSKMITLLLDPLSSILFKDERVWQQDDLSSSLTVGMVHLALAFPQHIPGLLKFVLHHYPEDARIRLPNDQLPLHIAASRSHAHPNNGDLTTSYREIFQCYPDAIRLGDHQQLNPFHLAAHVSNLTASFELLRLAPDIITGQD